MITLEIPDEYSVAVLHVPPINTKYRIRDLGLGYAAYTDSVR